MIIMDVEKYKELTAPCFRDSDPPCTDLCPLGMDVRKFISKMKDGKIKAAYRVFRPKAVFPAIVSALCPEPCMKGCTRMVKHGEPVRIRELEAFCTEQCVSKPDRYRLAKKEETVAVIGAGLSGLSCAYRLASRGYRVTVFEAGATVGGEALRLMDPEKAVEDVTREFSELDVCTFRTSHEVGEAEFSSLADAFDAVLIATGRDGSSFGLSRREPYKTDRPGIFMSGLLTGEKNQIEAMADGFNAAEYIEIFFKLGTDAAPDFSLSGTKEPDERFYSLHTDEAVLPAPEDPEDFDPLYEASKCYECNCSECFDVCSLMQKVRKYPKKIASDTIGTLRPNKYSRPGVRMIMGCTFCEKCRDVCPAGIDMGNFFRLARRDYYEDGTVPESFHEFWLSDMEFSLSDEACAHYTPDPEKPSRVVFFPGCQLAGMYPQLVENVYAWLGKCEENPSVYLGCCGVPAEWAGAEDKRKEAAARIRQVHEALGKPVFLAACTACIRNLREFCPEIETISLYSYMAEHETGLPKAAPLPGAGPFRIFDPCGASGDESTRTAVRRLAKSAGVTAAEPDGLPGCCGFGGHIYPADPALQTAFADEGAGSDGSTLITYCANCSDTFRKKGYESVHLLECYFGPGEGNVLPDLGARRNNKRALKAKLLSEEIMPYQCADDIVFSEQALEKMDRELILDEDVDRVLKDSPAFRDGDTGLIYSSARLGKITLWVVYSNENGKRVVTDVYKYRMEVEA